MSLVNPGSSLYIAIIGLSAEDTWHCRIVARLADDILPNLEKLTHEAARNRGFSHLN